MENPKVRAVLLFLLVLTFGVLLFGGQMMNEAKPPVPDSIRGRISVNNRAHTLRTVCLDNNPDHVQKGS